ncbi:hypothetical protein [Falsiroseomonas sp. E2-1-a20]|uniref:hypothetical protein n=1 Tax=Falsiroseomonas sp. E2-1-a20 TaxID=3239300 RepID=UPI003F31B288
MDPLTRILWRMAQWWRHPPSRTYVRILIVVLVLAMVLVLIERFIGWPAWMTTDRVPIRRM